jgi:predicted nucleic acid-binding protein
MNAVDTNVLAYINDPRDPQKTEAAKALVAGLEDGALVWQVVCEYLAMSRKLEPFGYSYETAVADLEELAETWTVLMPEGWDQIAKAVALQRSHSLSHWDSLLVAVCLRHGVEVIYTEDFDQHQEIEGIRVINPFRAEGAESTKPISP